MTNVLPVQEFQIGQRVRPDNGEPAFIIGMICAGADGEGLRYYGPKWSGIASELALAPPERPPYVPTQRRVIGHDKDYASQNYIDRTYRCETDTELAARHELEQIAHELEALP